MTKPTWGLKGKHILVAISAGVAAYKSCMLVRDLIRAGAEIKIVMTEAARAFVSAETLCRNLSGLDRRGGLHRPMGRSGASPYGAY